MRNTFFQQRRSVWMLCDKSMNASRALRMMTEASRADGTVDTINRKKFYEKPHERRNRKQSESAIRRANRKIGSMIDFILTKKRAYVLFVSIFNFLMAYF